MVRKKQTPEGEETKEKSPTSRQRKAVLIKKRENSSEVLPSSDVNASRLESFEQAASPPLEDFHTQIAIRAHELYKGRGGHHGQDLGDWFDAERQVFSEVQ